MARLTAQNVETIPYGPLGIIAMPGCEAFADKVDQYLVQWRKNQALEHQGDERQQGEQRGRGEGADEIVFVVEDLHVQRQRVGFAANVPGDDRDGPGRRLVA